MIHDPHTVLLIEDSRDDERLALRALRVCGLPLFVRVARDGQRALAALGLEASPEDPPRRAPDLVLSDLKMPRLNGDEVLARARADARLRDVPFVVFSSSAEPSDIERCMALGASAYAVKPVGYEEYVECAGQIARRWLSGDSAKRAPFCELSEAEGNPGLPSGVT